MITQLSGTTPASAAWTDWRGLLNTAATCAAVKCDGVAIISRRIFGRLKRTEKIRHHFQAVRQFLCSLRDLWSQRHMLLL